MIQLDFRAMGCDMQALLEAEGPQAAKALVAVPGWFAEWERHLSRFQADSELTRLNAQAGQPVRVSRVLWHALRASLRAARDSEGRVVPTLLEALEAAGYDRSFELITNAASGVSGAGVRVLDRPLRTFAAWQDIQLDAARQTVCLPRGARLDLGGIAKGWAADHAARRLGRWGPALVDAGGDVAVSGPRAQGAAWPVGVGAPSHWVQPAGASNGLLSQGHTGLGQPLILAIARGGVATSGRDFRRWQQGRVWQHHLIDPATGAPAATDVLSATVIAPSTREAEMAAKTAMLLGSQAGLDWIDERPQLAGVLVMEGGPDPVRFSRRLNDYLWS